MGSTRQSINKGTLYSPAISSIHKENDDDLVEVTRKSYDELCSDWASMLNQGLISQERIEREVEIGRESERDRVRSTIKVQLLYRWLNIVEIEQKLHIWRNHFRLCTPRRWRHRESLNSLNNRITLHWKQNTAKTLTDFSVLQARFDLTPVRAST